MLCLPPTLQLFDQLGELVVKQHLLWRRKDGLWLLSCSGIKLMLGDETQLLHKVFLPNPLLNQLL